MGLLMRDMALTHDEVVGLMGGLLTSEEQPTGTTRLSDWLAENADGLGSPVRVRAAAQLAPVGASERRDERRFLSGERHAYI